MESVGNLRYKWEKGKLVDLGWINYCGTRDETGISDTFKKNLGVSKGSWMKVF